MADNDSVGKVKIELESDADNLEAKIKQSVDKITSHFTDGFEKATEKTNKKIIGLFEKFRKKSVSESNAAGKSLSKTMIRSAADIKASFDMALGSIRTIISKSKELTAAYQTQIEAEARLAATMRNATNANKAQIESVKELASELQAQGVIGDEVQLAGAQELATYVSKTESIKKMLPVLDDMIAQQYGYNATTESAVTISTMLGKVLQGQTSALHRYGYSFDKAQEQILKYGTEEERVATLAEVISESVGGVNKTLGETPTGKIKQLSNDFGDLKEKLGQLITNVISPAVQFLDVIVNKLNSALEYLNGIVKQVFKIKDALGDNVTLGGLSSSADESTESIEGTTAAAEKLKKAVAGFDQLNILSDSNKSSETADTSSGSGSDAAPEEIEETVTAIDKKLDKIKSKFKNILKASELDKSVDIIKKDIDKINFDAIKNNFQTIMDSFPVIADASIEGVKKVTASKIKGIAVIIGGITRTVASVLHIVSGGVAKWLSDDKQKIADYITDITDNISSGSDKLSEFTGKLFEILNNSIYKMRPTMEAAIANMLSGFTAFSGEICTILAEDFDIAAGVINDWITENGDEIKEFFNNIQKIFADVMNGIGTVFEEISSTLKNSWGNGGRQMWEDFCRIVTDLGTLFMQAFSKWIMPLWNSFTNIVKSAWYRYIKPVFDSMSKAIINIWHNVLSPLWNNFLKPFLSWFIDKFGAALQRTLKNLENVFADVFGAVGGFISNAWNAFSSFGEFLNGVFTGDWRKALNGLSDTFKYTLEGMLSVGKGIINILIDGLNALWTGIYNVGSGVVDTLGGISGAIGNVFGQNWSFSMPAEIPLIPRLAKGGIISAPTLALVGDNKGASSGDPEVVSPLSKLKGMLGGVSDPEIIRLLMRIIALLESKEEAFPITINLDGEKIDSRLVKVRKRKQRRQGGIA